MLRIDLEGFTSDELLNLALIGLQHVHGEHASRMKALKARIAGEAPSQEPAVKPVVRARGKLSPQAKANIIAAQKKRWAKVHKEQRAAEKAATEKAAAKLAARAAAKSVAAVNKQIKRVRVDKPAVEVQGAANVA
jgi:hypothetical protein